MPEKGYSTIGIKPITNQKLRKITDEIHSMFIPTTLFMMMKQIENGDYTIFCHNLNLDLSGDYTIITIKDDIHKWLQKSFEEYAGEYEKKYDVKRFTFTKFLNYFILNIIKSKDDSQNQSVNLDKSNFHWLQKEYQKPKTNLQYPSFEEFINLFFNDLFSKIDKQNN